MPSSSAHEQLIPFLSSSSTKRPNGQSEELLKTPEMSQGHGEDPFKSPVGPSPVINPQGREECEAELRGWHSHAPGNGGLTMLRLLFSQERWQRAHLRHCWCRPRLHMPRNAPPLSSLLFFTCQSSSLRSTGQEWKDSSQWITLFSASVEMLMAQHSLLFRSPTFASVWLCKASVRTSHLTARKSYETLIIWKGKLNITFERLGQIPPFSIPNVQFYRYKRLFSLSSYSICFTHWLPVGLWQMSVGWSTQHSSVESKNLWKQDF